MRRYSVVYPALIAGFAAVVAASGCGNWQRVGAAQQPSTQAEATQMFDPNTLYQRLGRLVSSENVPFIGSVAFIPGRGDSTTAIVALSLTNRSFAFERDSGRFAAHYRVDYQFDPASGTGTPVMVSRENSILVATFQETLRTDESVIEQQKIQLAPGRYQLTVRVHDLGNAQVGNASKAVQAPAFGPGSYTAPILAYSVRGRSSRNDSLTIVLNPRGTVEYGPDTLLIYVEGNNFSRPTNIPLQVRDERDSVAFQTQVHFDGTGGVEDREIKLAPNSAPLGQLEILVGADNGTPPDDKFAVAPGATLHRTNAVVAFSNAWVVTNFDDLLSLLRYFGEDQRLAAMKRAKNSDRAQLWQDFYKATDPNPATPENEALDRYFARIAIANERFREPATPGWRTDRGEVFVVLGEPDEIHDQSAIVQNQGKVIYWEYTSLRLALYFQDQTGFNRFQLTPQSRGDFDQARSRLQRPAQRP